MNSADSIDRTFQAGHAPEGTELRTFPQAQLRKSVITELRSIGDHAGMSERQPSERALAFQRWMRAHDTNTRQVAVKADVPYSTLAAFIQGGTQNLKGNTEAKISAALGASPSELFADAEGQAPQRRLARVIGRVGANADGAVIMTTADDSWDLAPLPPGATSRSVALEVSGHSMHTFAEDGSLIYFEDQKTPPDPEMINYPCVVETEDGRVLVKRLRKGSEPGLFDLESIAGPTIRDVRIVWAAEIIAVVPPRQARRIIIRGGEYPN